LKFRRQHPIDKFIVDFYCHEAKLAIELDGGGHTEAVQAKYDKERTESLEGEGIRVLRFWNTDVFKNLKGVIETIADAIPSPLIPLP
jgi:very-short-patch-repair endonuclease